MALVYESACPACGSVIKHCVSKTRVGPAPEPAEYDITDDASVVKSLFTPGSPDVMLTTETHSTGTACSDCGKPGKVYSDGAWYCDRCNRRRSKEEASE